MDVNNTYTGVEQPSIVYKRFGRSTMYYVPYNITEEAGTYTYSYVPVTPSNYTYGGLVDAIIGVRYPLKEALAIINNYLYDSENEKYIAEFDEMQKWRQFAKDESKKHFKL